MTKRSTIEGIGISPNYSAKLSESGITSLENAVQLRCKEGRTLVIRC